MNRTNRSIILLERWLPLRAGWDALSDPQLVNDVSERAKTSGPANLDGVIPLERREAGLEIVPRVTHGRTPARARVSLQSFPIRLVAR